MRASSPQPLSSVNSSNVEVDFYHRDEPLRGDSTVNAVFTTNAKDVNWSEGTFPLQPFFVPHLLLWLLHVYLFVLHISLTDGVSFEMRLPFGNCGCLFAFASWFNGLRILEDEDHRQVLRPLRRNLGQLLLE